MSEHKRRDGYWQYYEPAKETEASHLKRTLIEIIRESPCPRTESTTRGRPPVHSKDKLDFMCLWMVAVRGQPPSSTHASTALIRLFLLKRQLFFCEGVICRHSHSSLHMENDEQKHQQ